MQMAFAYYHCPSGAALVQLPVSGAFKAADQRAVCRQKRKDKTTPFNVTVMPSVILGCPCREVCIGIRKVPHC